MKAARLVGPQKFEIMDVPDPVPGDQNCIVKLERWSICGSDIRHEYGTVFQEEHYPLDAGFPCHELVGSIVDSRSDLWAEGQRVIVIPHLGANGLTEYTEALPNRMIPIPNEGDAGDWLMCQPSGTVLYALQETGVLLGKRILILGQGPIGLSFTAICARSGARQVIAADLHNYRLEYSQRFGATHSINPTAEPLDEAVDTITEGEMPDITIEAAGYPDTLAAAIRLVKVGGRIVMFGQQPNSADGQMAPLDAKELLYKNAKLRSTAASQSGDVVTHIKTMVELRQRGWWDPAEMITHQLKFRDLQTAYDMYQQREDEVIKIMMQA